MVAGWRLVLMAAFGDRHLVSPWQIGHSRRFRYDSRVFVEPIAMSRSTLAQLVNVFKPTPLPADSPVYVDLQAVRGDANIFRDLGRKIDLNPGEVTYQLYAGHRGGGKSTELMRLKKSLEDKKHRVMYFAADEDDIDPEDAQYTDILIACTRHLLQALEADSAPLQGWLKACWTDLKDLALREVQFDEGGKSHQP